MRGLSPTLRFVALSLAFLLPCFEALAQATARLSTVLDWARTSDAQFAAAHAAALSGREKLPQARAGLLPSVNLTASGRRNRESGATYVAPAAYDSESVGLSLNQPVFRLANWIGADQAEAQVKLTDLQLRLAEQDMLLRVAQAYFDILQAQDGLSAATAQKEALAQQLAQMKRSFEVGTVAVMDLNETRARHDLAVAQEIAALNELEVKKRTLEKSIGRPVPTLSRLSDAVAADRIDRDSQQAFVDSAARTSLPVLISHAAVDVADQEVARRRAAHTPTVDLVASVRSDKNSNYNQIGRNELRQASIGIEVSVPLYQGGGTSSRVREAQADRQRALDELTDAQRQAQLDARQAQLDLQSGKAMTSALGQALESGRVQLRSAQRGLQVGLRTLVDVLNAEQQLYSTRKDLAIARYRTLVAGLKLRAAAGDLAEADIRVLDSLLVD